MNEDKSIYIENNCYIKNGHMDQEELTHIELNQNLLEQININIKINKNIYPKNR